MPDPTPQNNPSVGTVFWNLTDGVRPPEPTPGFYAGLCFTQGHVLDDPHYPKECARCGHRPPRRRWWRR